VGPQICINRVRLFDQPFGWKLVEVDSLPMVLVWVQAASCDY